MDPLAFFRQALEGLQAEIAQVAAERLRAQQQVEACDRQLEQLRAEQKGIESYVQRHEHQDQQVTENERAVEPMPVHDPADGWGINRAEAVARVLIEAGEPLSPGAIVDALGRVGRSDTMKDVAAALSHLKKRHRAMNVSRGPWAATTQSLEQAWGDDETGEDEEEVGSTTMR